MMPRSAVHPPAVRAAYMAFKRTPCMGSESAKPKNAYPCRDPDCSPPGSDVCYCPPPVGED